MLIAAVGALGGARDRRSMDNNRIASVGGTTARSNTRETYIVNGNSNNI
jgi:hypothetical protein